MSKKEQYAWASLVTSGLIFFFFQMRMLDGWQVVEQTPGRLIGVYVAVVVLAIIAESVMSGFIFARKQGAVETDERDKAIDARAEANAGIFITAALNVIIIHALAAAAFEGNAFEPLTHALALDTPAQIFFVLFAILFAGHWVKCVSSIILYRG